MPTRCKVFISYSHEDEKLKDSKVKMGAGYPQTFLSRLRAAIAGHPELLTPDEIFFDDSRLATEPTWRPAIENALTECDLLILLVSPHSVVSDFCMKEELPRAVGRNVPVITVLLRPSADWHLVKVRNPARGKEVGLGEFHAGGVPKESGNAKPISTWENEEDAWARACQAILDFMKTHPPRVTPARGACIPNPYPGLVAFTPASQRFFFSRDEDIPRVVERLADGQFVCVIGASGTGKSSLIAAGVGPALGWQHPGLSYLRFTPKRDPVAQFSEALDRLLPEERLTSYEADRRTDIAEAMVGDAAAAVGKYLEQLPRPVLVFVDQFEELFTQTAEKGRAGFKPVFDALAAAERVMLVLTLRSEFYARLAEWLRHPALETRLVNLEPIRDTDRLAELIRRPAVESGVAIDAAVVDDLVRQAGAMTNSLPLLALTLRRLFDRRDLGRGITQATLTETGGIARSIATAAEPVDMAIDAKASRATACFRLFAALATVVEGVAIRRSAEVASLRADPEIASLVDAIRSQGLLADLDEAHVAIAHEAVFSHWPRLTDWCLHYGVKLDLRRQAELAARDWHKAVGAERTDAQSVRRRASDALRWGWDRQKPAIEALLELRQFQPKVDADYTDPGIHAWRALEGELGEPLCSFLYPEPLRLIEELSSDATPHARREDIGRRLDAMGDPRHGVGLDDRGLPDIVWERIAEAGEITLETKPTRKFSVAPFWIARYPVTWAQYKAFLTADDGYKNPRAPCWKGLTRADEPGERKWDFDNHPVIHVSWHDAMAFCAWLSTRLGLALDEQVRLPTEWEWQWVAQSRAAGQAYPWGDDWNSARTNSYDAGVGRTVAVGLYPLGVPEDAKVMDLAGNVWERCLNERSFPQDVALKGNASRAFRGGSWFNPPVLCRAAARGGSRPGNRYEVIGFRVCRGSPIDPRGAGSLGTDAPDR
ncbi:MAG: SUMF1/EgtB/PvdO family nonheme iron enzyme [Thauera sp.]|nr:SUMF1/EgtB/PvdO family nonheme iron enzyme [Thauera sp.]